MRTPNISQKAKYCKPLHLCIPQIISGSVRGHWKLQHQPSHNCQKAIGDESVKQVHKTDYAWAVSLQKTLTLLKTSSSLRIVGQFDGFIFSGEFFNAQDWTKDFLPPNFH